MRRAAAIPATKAQQLQTGQSVADVPLINQDGKTLHLRQFKGKAVLVNFWATWCAPCKIETPWLVELRSQYAAQGFEILGVSADDLDRDDATKLAEEKKEIGRSAAWFRATLAS